MTPFATNLRRRAASLQLTQAEVARRANLDPRRYGNYATGRREPDLATLRVIAETLRISIDELLGSPRHLTKRSHLELLQDRLALAGAGLAESDLELVILQVEALLKQRRA